MIDERPFARLTERGTAGAAPDPAFAERLYAMLVPEINRRPRPARSLVLIAALLALLALGAAAVAGGLVRLPWPEAGPLDPASLDPCEVLPGPGIAPNRPPLTHTGHPALGGQACGYRWDGGPNPHFQLRSAFTTEAEALALVDGVMPSPREVLIEDGTVRAWLGTVAAMEYQYVAVIGHRDPYLFVAYLRAGDKPTGVPLPPTRITDGDRTQAEDLVWGVVANLEALNARSEPEFVLEISQ